MTTIHLTTGATIESTRTPEEIRTSMLKLIEDRHEDELQTCWLLLDDHGTAVRYDRVAAVVAD